MKWTLCVYVHCTVNEQLGTCTSSTPLSLGVGTVYNILSLKHSVVNVTCKVQRLLTGCPAGPLAPITPGPPGRPLGPRGPVLP